MQKILLVFSFFCSISLSAQDTLMPVILLDDVVISVENNGFTVEDFVGYVKKDTTFYMGFKHLRYFTHDYESELHIFNKKGNIIGTLKKEGTHYSNGEKAWLFNDTIFDEGKIFKRNGDYKYYTPEAFDEVFFPKDTIDVSLKMTDGKNKEDSQNMRDAKTIGFSIGTDEVEQSKGGVSKKLAIFDIDMQQYYDYTISDTTYNGRACYVFTVKVKEELKAREKDKALIRKIVSYFDKENFNVIYREYKFVYDYWLIDLDMDVVVHMDYVNEKHIPTDIHYKGFWDVLFFKPERAEFKLKNTNYLVD
ncbi:MAG: hypothetical protein HON40_00255 [Flavobacteriales bacterium]|jgi:hypothetical protein|nr:hypothetical protein [Flavobacteriales bacterium]MDC3395318.1 hypothetical protein [Flavobacteriales bacterium]MDG1348400.1 hypothetical protein [Flavobacteriales bacterium]